MLATGRGASGYGSLPSPRLSETFHLAHLLAEGIGDTIRVSLAGPSKEEVKTGFEILKSLNLREKGPILVACPSCGRADVDVLKLTASVEKFIKEVKTPLKIAVMGCEVNGPGEGKDADIGIAGGNGRAIIFRKGVKVKIVAESEMLEALMEEVRKTEAEMAGS
ncbi:MAG: flavodoxin-dependent (E)-4-hydroxy-3-methylbut-2-enyl-diphosphate synthase [Proteobacteria bacterium]|nr:flavodoxin-dependent (E)-4-hydroxy-3-methylbut-2-enyl-diphosphate synthase [Pseudomonadota bacterium]